MHEFLYAHGGTLLVGALVAGMIVWILFRGIRRRKQGKRGCGCSCSGCGLCEGHCPSRKE